MKWITKIVQWTAIGGIILSVAVIIYKVCGIPSITLADFKGESIGQTITQIFVILLIACCGGATFSAMFGSKADFEPKQLFLWVVFSVVFWTLVLIGFSLLRSLGQSTDDGIQRVIVVLVSGIISQWLVFRRLSPGKSRAGRK